MPVSPGTDFLRHNVIGLAPAFLESLERIRRISAAGATALIQGETGTGKELAARAIHYLGPRRAFPFVAVNCGAIPESLIESEFFGHVRGAFTDAKDAREGLVAQASGGTLFLDELEVLSPRGQVVLLRFLQDHVYAPIGGGASRKANVRIIGATNTDLAALASRGSYRLDLVFRLGVLSVCLPPLRDRPGDPRLLASAFVQRFCRQYQCELRPLSAAAVQRLDRYEWPGNVRELENAIHREVVLSDSSEIALSEIDIGPVADPPHDPSAGSGSVASFGAARARVLADFEKTYVTELLARTRGNVSLAARIAGKDRSRFGKLIRKHGLERDDFVRRAG
jgi:DNA-binding NtrC family response regulator